MFQRMLLYSCFTHRANLKKGKDLLVELHEAQLASKEVLELACYQLRSNSNCVAAPLKTADSSLAGPPQGAAVEVSSWKA